MRSVTTEAALIFFREDDVSFVIDNEMLALGGDIGEYAVASRVVSACDFVSSLPVVGGIVEELSVKSVGMVVPDEGLVVGDIEGRTPEGR